MSVEHKNIDELRERLALGDKLHHAERERLAQSKDALTIARLRELPEFAEPSAFADVEQAMGVVGWPSDFSRAETMLGDVFLGEEADDWFRYVIEHTDFRLGNFLRMFNQPPTLDPQSVNHHIDKIYATKPAVNRLFAVNRMLVEDVVEVVNGKTSAQDWNEYLQQFDKGGKNIALTIIRQAYMTMTRLVSGDDEVTHYRLLNYTNEPEPIGNIGTYLTK